MAAHVAELCAAADTHTSDERERAFRAFAVKDSNGGGEQLDPSVLVELAIVQSPRAFGRAAVLAFVEHVLAPTRPSAALVWRRCAPLRDPTVWQEVRAVVFGLAFGEPAHTRESPVRAELVRAALGAARDGPAAAAARALLLDETERSGGPSAYACTLACALLVHGRGDAAVAQAAQRLVAAVLAVARDGASASGDDAAGAMENCNRVDTPAIAAALATAAAEWGARVFLLEPPTDPVAVIAGWHACARAAGAGAPDEWPRAVGAAVNAETLARVFAVTIASTANEGLARAVARALAASTPSARAEAALGDTLACAVDARAALRGRFLDEDERARGVALNGIVDELLRAAPGSYARLRSGSGRRLDALLALGSAAAAATAAASASGGGSTRTVAVAATMQASTSAALSALATRADDGHSPESWLGSELTELLQRAGAQLGELHTEPAGSVGFAWLVCAVHHPHFTAALFDGVLPTMLRLLDRHEHEHREAGLAVLGHTVAELTAAELRWHRPLLSQTLVGLLNDRSRDGALERMLPLAIGGLCLVERDPAASCWTAVWELLLDELAMGLNAQITRLGVVLAALPRAIELQAARVALVADELIELLLIALGGSDPRLSELAAAAVDVLVRHVWPALGANEVGRLAAAVHERRALAGERPLSGSLALERALREVLDTLNALAAHEPKLTELLRALAAAADGGLAPVAPTAAVAGPAARLVTDLDF